MKKSSLWLIIFLGILVVVIVAYNLLPRSSLSPLVTITSPIDCSLGSVQPAPGNNPSPPSYLGSGPQFWTPLDFGLAAGPPSQTDCLISAKTIMDSFLGPLPLGPGGGALTPQVVTDRIAGANLGAANINEQFGNVVIANTAMGYNVVESDRLPGGLFNSYNNQVPVNLPITTNAIQQNNGNPYPFVISFYCYYIPTQAFLSQNPNALPKVLAHAVLALGPEITLNPASPTGMSLTGGIVCSDPQMPGGSRIVIPTGRGQTPEGEKDLIEVPSAPSDPGYTMQQCWVKKTIVKG